MACRPVLRLLLVSLSNLKGGDGDEGRCDRSGYAGAVNLKVRLAMKRGAPRLKAAGAASIRVPIWFPVYGFRSPNRSIKKQS